MNKKGKRRLPKTFRESEVRSLFEYFESKLDLVLEHIAAMGKKLDDVTEDIHAGRCELRGLRF